MGETWAGLVTPMALLYTIEKRRCIAMQVVLVVTEDGADRDKF